MIRQTIKSLILALLLLVPFSMFCAATDAKRASSNIILILTDDLGWTDVGCFGSKFHELPNID